MTVSLQGNRNSSNVISVSQLDADNNVVSISLTQALSQIEGNILADTNNLANNYYDKANIDSKISTINTNVTAKPNKFLITETVPANTGRLFDADNTKFRAINVNAPLSITTPNFNCLSLSCDAYTKTS